MRVSRLAFSELKDFWVLICENVINLPVFKLCYQTYVVIFLAFFKLNVTKCELSVPR